MIPQLCVFPYPCCLYPYACVERRGAYCDPNLTNEELEAGKGLLFQVPEPVSVCPSFGLEVSNYYVNFQREPLNLALGPVSPKGGASVNATSEENGELASHAMRPLEGIIEPGWMGRQIRRKVLVIMRKSCLACWWDKETDAS